MYSVFQISPYTGKRLFCVGRFASLLAATACAGKGQYRVVVSQ